MRLTVELSWEANAESDLAGYKITWANRAVLVQKTVTAIKLSVMVKPKLVYEFYVSAFDMAGNVSEPKTLKAVYVEG